MGRLSKFDGSLQDLLDAPLKGNADNFMDVDLNAFGKERPDQAIWWRDWIDQNASQGLGLTFFLNPTDYKHFPLSDQRIASLPGKVERLADEDVPLGKIRIRAYSLKRKPA